MGDVWDDLKSRIMFPLKERDNLFYSKRGIISIYNKEESSPTQIDFVTVSQYHKALNALEVAEKELISILKSKTQ